MCHWKKNKLRRSQRTRRVFVFFSAAAALSAVFFFALGWGLIAPLSAQELPTATPDAEGVIYDQVRPGDTLWAIASRHGLGLQELLALNGLSETDFIQPGDLLIVGYGEPPATETPLPTITPTFPPPPPPATAVPPPPTGVCLLAFDDPNQNGLRDPDESLRAGVAITLYNSDAVVANVITDGISEPVCFDDLTPGEYRLTRSRNTVQGERLTTEGDQGVIVRRGQMLDIALGSIIPDADAPIVATAPPTPLPNPLAATAVPPTPAPSSPGQKTTTPLWPWLLGTAVLLTAALGLWRRQRRQPND